MNGLASKLPSGPALQGILAALVAGVAGWQLSSWLTADAATLIGAGHLKDDAFFYSELVDRFRELGFFTLDGTMPTNGFQPLWMALLLALKALAPDTQTLELLRQLSWVSYVGFCFLLTWFVAGSHHAADRPWDGLFRVGFVAGALLLNRRFQDAVVEGLEPPLALALLVGVLIALGPLTRRMQASKDDHRRQFAAAGVFGLLGALVFFARTDLFWLTGLLGIWCWWSSGRRVGPLVAVVLVAAAVVTPYLVWNWSEHGAVVPVSGRVKVFLMDAFLASQGQSYWDTESWRGLISLFGTWLPEASRSTMVVLSYGLVVTGLGIVFSPRGRRELPDGYRLLGVLVVLHAVYMQLVYREVRPYTNYYFAPELLFVVLSVAAWFSTLRPRPGVVLLVVLLLLGSRASWGSLDLKPRTYWTQRLAISADLETLAKGAPVGSFWPGMLAGVTDLDVTPLDGVIGSQAYFEEAVKTGGEIDYALNSGLRYILVHGNPKSFLGKRKPKPTRWSTTDLAKVWERRDHFRVAKRKGPWTILEVIAPGSSVKPRPRRGARPQNSEG